MGCLHQLPPKQSSGNSVKEEVGKVYDPDGIENTEKTGSLKSPEQTLIKLSTDAA